MNIAESIKSVIQDTPPGIMNLTEWCKKVLYLQNVQRISIEISPQIKGELTSGEDRKWKASQAKTVQKIDNGIQAHKYELEKNRPFWCILLEWAQSSRMFFPKESSLLQVASQIPLKFPSVKQSLLLTAIEQKAIEDGFVL